MEQKIWDVVIIGSGPSGLTAAIYTTRGALTTYIAAGEKWGGQLMLTTEVDNFPGFEEGIMGPELMTSMKNQAQRFGAEFVAKNVTSVDFSQKPLKIFHDQEVVLASSVIVATGAETVWLDVPGESKLIGRGISSCAPCDAPFFKDKNVFVVGGGDSAMEEALVLTKYATQVTIIHRRNEFKASKVMQDKVFANPKIKVLWNKQVVEVIGQEKFEGVLVKDVESGQQDKLSADGMFVAIGHRPMTDIFKEVLDLDQKGFLNKFESDNYKMKTKIEGVFVAGDVHDHTYKQAITAAGFGCMAGMDAIKYLSETSGVRG